MQGRPPVVATSATGVAEPGASVASPDRQGLWRSPMLSGRRSLKMRA